MKSIGEAMSLRPHRPEALNKAMRSMETTWGGGSGLFGTKVVAAG